jgi:hypothetical protein
MKKLIIIFLVFFISCGPSEEEIQSLIDEAVEQATSTTTTSSTSTTTSSTSTTSTSTPTTSTSTPTTSTSTSTTSTSTPTTSTSTSTTIPYKYEYWGLMFDKTNLTDYSNFEPWDYLDGLRFCILDGHEGYSSNDYIYDESGKSIDFSKPVTKFTDEISLRGHSLETVSYDSTDKLIKDFSNGVCDMAYLEIQTINKLIENNNKKDIWLIHQVGLFEIIKP